MPDHENALELAPARTVRRYDFDGLKVCSTIAVFLFHCARFFDPDPWHVKNNQLSAEMGAIASILAQWMMPLFFILSGASIYLALRVRTPQQFLHDRLIRLGVPLLIGIGVLAPPQVYIERLGNPVYSVAPSQDSFSGSFLEFYPRYFEGWYGFGGNFAWMGLHLWYLLVLLVFSFLTLPLFLRLKGKPLQRLLDRLSGYYGSPITLFLLAVPLAFSEWALDPETVGIRVFGGWNLLTYWLLLVYGYLMVTDARVERSLHCWGALALGLAVGTTPLLGLIRSWAIDPAMHTDWGYALLIGWRALNAWFWLVALLKGGKHVFSRSHFLLQYATEASLPFYMLHQPVIVTIGFLIAPWAIGVLPKFCLLSLASLIMTLLLYEGLIKRVKEMRFLFGLRLQD